MTTRKLAVQPPPPVNAHLSLHTCHPLHAALCVLLSPRSYISDITTSQCRQLLKKEATGSLFDVVLHDGAPNVGGAWSSEAYTQVGGVPGAQPQQRTAQRVTPQRCIRL